MDNPTTRGDDGGDYGGDDDSDEEVTCERLRLAAGCDIGVGGSHERTGAAESLESVSITMESKEEVMANGKTCSIPSNIGNLGRLTILSLHFNNLNGTIPLEIGNLVNMQFLKRDANHLSGIIPKSLGRLKNLDTLTLGGNQLEAIHTA
ncbi:receptor-like protein 43 [Zingiber officinale]|uniref:receptor-like protein 43 n=1 Tax=Zingiber officinale TaxID=94328 RepID=UPI001C4A7D57|nr:receptor-like protein 43 [Zingiber officinale]